MKKLILIQLFFTLNFLIAQNTENYNYWVTDGTVRAIASDATNTYIGGEFNYVGPQTGAGVVLTTTNTTPNSSHMRIRGTVYCSVSDNSGGWFVGGYFDYCAVDSVTVSNSHKHLIHILSNGQLDLNWKPNVSSTVLSLAVQNNFLYIGGSFDKVGGIKRNGLARVNILGIGSVDTIWNPKVNRLNNGQSEIKGIAIKNQAVYIAGGFDSVGSSYRFGSAKCSNSGTGQVDPNWNPKTSSLSGIVCDSNSVYIRGLFSSVNYLPISYIAKLDNTIGILDTTWNPLVNGQVRSIDISGANMYLGGDFTIVKGQNRNRLVKLNKSGVVKIDSVWTPNVDATVNSIYLNGTDLYIGGRFSSVNNIKRISAAKISSINSGSTDLTWDAKIQTVFDIVNNVNGNGNSIFIGGNFYSLGGIYQDKIAKLKLDGSADTNWKVNSNGIVHAIELDDENVYFGGSGITIVNGQTRSNIVKVSKSGVVDINFKPVINGAVKCLKNRNLSLFVGGSFTMTDTFLRMNAVKLKKSNGKVIPAWKPQFSGEVRTIDFDPINSILYAGGLFTAVDNKPIKYLAKIDSGGVLDTIWNAKPDGSVNAIRLIDSDIYVGGSFNNIGNNLTNVQRIAKLKANGIGLVYTNWRPYVDNYVNTMDNCGNSSLYIGGYFSKKIKKIDIPSGQIDSSFDFNLVPQLPYAIEVYGSKLRFGGSFYNVTNTHLREFMAEVNIVPCSNNYALKSTNNLNNLANPILSIYPNPSRDGQFTIESKEPNTCIIMNQLGQIVTKVELNEGNNYTSNVNMISKGLYFIKSNKVDTHKVYKLIIE
jgi:trimeric autotransporter adhesin